MASSWRFRHRQGLCSGCGSSFAEGESLYSLLRLTEQELERGDLCRGCFEQRSDDQDLYWWRTQHREGRHALRLDFEVLLHLLQELDGEQQAERLDFRFLLALLMVRHRKLRLISVQRQGSREQLTLRKPRSKQTFQVEVREIDEERRRKLSAALAGLLDPGSDADLADLLPESA